METQIHMKGTRVLTWFEHQQQKDVSPPETLHHPSVTFLTGSARARVCVCHTQHELQSQTVSAVVGVVLLLSWYQQEDSHDTI